MKYLIGIVIGVLLSSLFMFRDPVLVYTPKVKVRREVVVDYDTIPMLEVDTLYRDTTQYTIPVFDYAFAESLPFYVNKDLKHLPFELGVRGYVKDYSLETKSMIFTIKPQPDPSLKYYRLGCVGLVGVIGLLTYLLIRG